VAWGAITEGADKGELARLERLFYTPDLEPYARPRRAGRRPAPPPVDTSTAGENVAALMRAMTTGVVE
jgi:hypothetical protein